MKELHSLAYEYHQTFHSYREHIGLRSKQTVFITVSFLVFLIVAISVIFFREMLVPYASENALLIFMFSLEITFLAVWFKIDHIKSQIAKEKVENALRRRFETHSDAQQAWLEKKLKIPREEFISLAKDLREALTFERQHESGSAPSWDTFFRSIYDPDSKARVISLGIFFLSFIGLALLRVYDGLDTPAETIFKIYQEGWGAFPKLFLVAATFWGFLLVLMFSKDFLIIVLSSISTWLDGQQSRSKRNAYRLLAALVEHAAIPRKK